ncbi:MAG: TIGR01212 family radical SAM protein [Syntrophaceae bacterium]|nr:TIGR01212 family radical SAM protein [Syntrophaceae bacterium]
MAKPDYWNNRKRYYDLKSYWLNRFGCRVYKLPVDAGFTCPNRDGTVAAGGCIYCDGRGSRVRMEGPLPSVTDQLLRGMDYYREHRRAARFIAYFQTFTNTYAPVEHLRELFREALALPDVAGLSIGTRPDCLPDEVLDLLEELAQDRHVWLELGLQSIHDRTLARINRGHRAERFLEAVDRASGRNLNLCVHIIAGLPGETRGDVLETARTLAGLPVDGIKIHCLLVLSGTPLGALYEREPFPLWSREQYVEAVCDVLEILPPRMTIQRLTADGYRDIFLAPEWAVNKMAVLGAIDRELERRDAHQGIRFEERNT